MKIRMLSAFVCGAVITSSAVVGKPAAKGSSDAAVIRGSAARTVLPSPPDPSLMPQGSIVGWGSQVVGVDLSQGFVNVAGGGLHSLGLKVDGSIVAWGRNNYGQCNVPAANTGFVAVAAGGAHSVGLNADGSIVAWGRNDYGQCNVPAPNGGFVGVAAGGDNYYGGHTLGLKADGSIVAWGANYSGQCNVPAPNTGFVGVAAGYLHNLGLKADGSIVAWGNNGAGATNVPAPNTGFVAVAAGGWHSLGLKADGSIVAWGSNGYGQTNVPAPNTGFVAIAAGGPSEYGGHSLGLKGDGTIVGWGAGDPNNTTWPNNGESIVPAPNTGFVAVAAGFYHSLGLKTDGSIVAWGSNRWGQTNVPAPNTGFVAVVETANHSLGLKADGSLVGLGDNRYGQTNVPAPNTNFVGVAAGGCHSLGLRGDGSIVAWGCEGACNKAQCNVPAPNAEFVAVAAGFYHSLGLKTDGSIVAWGYNFYGQANVPASNEGFVGVAAGYSHSLGVKADGSIVAWGSNRWGQTNVPAPNTGFVGIAGRAYHSMGLKANGSIVAWGCADPQWDYGQCAAPDTNSGFVAVAAGERHNQGLKGDGSIAAWGFNDYGQCDVPVPNAGFVAVAAGDYHSLAIRGSASAPAPSSAWAAARYDAPAATVFVSASAFEPTTGTYVIAGDATYSIPQIARWGPLTFDGDKWRATVDLLDDPPPPGTYQVNVDVGGGHGEATFSVPGDGGSIHGTVYNVASEPFENVTVSLHEPQILDVTMFETQTGPDGTYELTGVPPGWYSVLAKTDGYLPQTTGVRIRDGEATEYDFSLSSTCTLRQLWAPMNDLYTSVREAMDYETARVSVMTGQAAGHFNAHVDAWDLVSFLSDVLGGVATSGASAFSWVTQQATRETAKGVLTALVKDAATDSLIGWLVFQNAAEITENATVLMLPDGQNQWRAYGVAELKALPAYAAGVDALEQARADFVAISGDVVVSLDFDFARAKRVIDKLNLQIERIANGDLVSQLVSPQVDPPFMYAGFPNARRVWLSFDDLLRKYSGAKKVTTAIKAPASALAVSATVSVVGAGVGGIAGAVALVSSGVGFWLNALEVPTRWLAVQNYVVAIKQWNNDMLTLPEVYSTTWEFLQAEADEPIALGSDPSAYAATADLDMQADAYSDGDPLVYTDNLFDSMVSRQALVTVTNTGTAPARVRAVGVSYKQFDGTRSVGTGAGYLDLDPGEGGAIQIPYVGISKLTDPWSPHVLRAEVYVGPFLAKSFFQPYRVRRGLFAASAVGDSDSHVLTYLKQGESRRVGGADEEMFEPVMTQLADTTLVPDEAIFDTVFASASAPAVEFQMQADAHGVVELRVYDEAGDCVGYDSSRGGVVIEFPAQYNGDGSTQQSVYIPAPGAAAYTVRAVLTGAMSDDPVGVSLWALETPVRPPVLGVAPAAYSTRLYWGESATIPLSVAEAGGQAPLSNVAVSVSDVSTLDGASMLNVTAGAVRSYPLIAAGTTTNAEVRLEVPRWVSFGAYDGSIAISSDNAGSQVVPIHVTVLPMGDFDADENVGPSDLAAQVACLTGPSAGPVSLECWRGDFDGDDDVDLYDAALFQSVYSGE